jgi:hypothetical protein
MLFRHIRIGNEAVTAVNVNATKALINSSKLHSNNLIRSPI